MAHDCLDVCTLGALFGTSFLLFRYYDPTSVDCYVLKYVYSLSTFLVLLFQ